MFNDTMQGRAEHLGICLAGTPDFFLDSERGLLKDEAWARRISKSRYAKSLQDISAPVIILKTLTEQELLILLQRVADVHATHFDYEQAPGMSECEDFVQNIAHRLGAEALLTPQEVVSNFISVLNILQQNPEISLSTVL